MDRFSSMYWAAHTNVANNSINIRWPLREAIDWLSSGPESAHTATQHSGTASGALFSFQRVRIYFWFIERGNASHALRIFHCGSHNTHNAAICHQRRAGFAIVPLHHWPRARARRRINHRSISLASHKSGSAPERNRRRRFLFKFVFGRGVNKKFLGRHWKINAAEWDNPDHAHSTKGEWTALFSESEIDDEGQGQETGSSSMHVRATLDAY